MVDQSMFKAEQKNILNRELGTKEIVTEVRREEAVLKAGAL